MVGWPLFPPWAEGDRSFLCISGLDKQNLYLANCTGTEETFEVLFSFLPFLNKPHSFFQGNQARLIGLQLDFLYVDPDYLY